MNWKRIDFVWKDGQLKRVSRLSGCRGNLRGDVTLVTNSSGTSPITVPSTTTVYSKTFQLKHGQAFGIWYQAGNGSGTANMSINIEQSYVTPTTEGSSDSKYVVGNGVSAINSNLNDTTAHVASISPVPMKYGRLKIAGLGGNPADATLTAYIFQQEIVS